MPLNSSILFLIFLLTVVSCGTSKHQGTLNEVDYEALICLILKINLEKETFGLPNECLNINRKIEPGNRAIPIKLKKSGVDITIGRFARSGMIDRMSLDCQSEWGVYFVDDQSNDDPQCLYTLTFTDPYFIDDKTLYVYYSLDCGDLCGEGYELILKIRGYTNYEVQKKEQIYIE